MASYKYICSWCPKDNFDSYGGHSERDTMHFNMDFMNGVQREYVCSFCPWGTFIEYEQYRNHEDAHYQIRSISDTKQPAPKRRKLFFHVNSSMQETDHENVIENNDFSPIHGPSHAFSLMPIPTHKSQIGRGSSSDGTLKYDIEKVNVRTFKNSVVDAHYKVSFDIDQSKKGEKLSNMYNSLENMFDDVITHATTGLQGSDLGRIVIHHDALMNPVYVSLSPLDKLTGNDVMEYLQNVLNSHEDLPLDQSFRLDVGTMELPKGGRGDLINCLSGFNNSLKQKSPS